MSEERRPLILHVIHHLYIGGMENGLVNSRQSAAGIAFSTRDRLRRRLLRFPVAHLPRRRRVIALNRSKIAFCGMRNRAAFELCGRLRPAVVHTRNLSGLDALLPVLLAAFGIVCTRTRLGHERPPWRSLETGTFAQCAPRPLIDRYVTVSKHLARYLAERIGVPSERISVDPEWCRIQSASGRER
jgi:hypothetical protein